MTINEALVIQRAIRDRIADLKELRNQVSVKELWGDSNRVKEPQYDVAKVDAMISKLKVLNVRIDSLIKQKNATVQIDIDVDVEEMLAPIQ